MRIKSLASTNWVKPFRERGVKNRIDFVFNRIERIIFRESFVEIRILDVLFGFIRVSSGIGFFISFPRV